MRRFIRSGIYMAVVCTVLMLSASISFADEDSEPEISLMALNYDRAYAALSISAHGTATASGRIVGIPGKTTKVSIHLYLQKYSSGKWTSVADWTGSKAASSYTLKKTKNVAKGHEYRTKAVCTVYAGSSAEKTTKYSTAVKY